jgi:hypothetical protein
MPISTIAIEADVKINIDERSSGDDRKMPKISEAGSATSAKASPPSKGVGR